MPDTVAVANALPEKAGINLKGKVVRVYSLTEKSSGVSQHGAWWMQNLMLADDEGQEIRVTVFTPYPIDKPEEARTLGELMGQEVIASGVIEKYEGKSQIKVRGLEHLVGATLRNASSASAPAASTATPPPASQRPGTITDSQWVEWAEEMAEEVARMPWLARMSGDHAGAVQAALATMWIAAQKGELRLTKGPFGKAEKPQAEEEPQGVVADPGDDIPFALFLAPLLGAVLAALGVG